MSFFSMTKTAIASLFKKPETIAVPELAGHVKPRTRGHVAVEIGDCIWCGLCARRCPTGAIEVTKAESAWSIERFRCIQCGGCVEACPKKCLRMETAQTEAAFEKGRDVFTNA